MLRARRKRPRHRATEQRDEVAALHRCNHSITSSASASSVGGAADLLFERKRAALVDVLIYLLLRRPPATHQY